MGLVCSHDVVESFTLTKWLRSRYDDGTGRQLASLHPAAAEAEASRGCLYLLPLKKGQMRPRGTSSSSIPRRMPADTFFKSRTNDGHRKCSNCEGPDRECRLRQSRRGKQRQAAAVDDGADPSSIPSPPSEAGEHVRLLRPRRPLSPLTRAYICRCTDGP